MTLNDPSHTVIPRCCCMLEPFYLAIFRINTITEKTCESMSGCIECHGRLLIDLIYVCKWYQSNIRCVDTKRNICQQCNIYKWVRSTTHCLCDIILTSIRGIIHVFVVLEKWSKTTSTFDRKSFPQTCFMDSRGICLFGGLQVSWHSGQIFFQNCWYM